jgi:hypothetical protein
MAVVWTTTMTVGVNTGGGGYIQSSTGTLTDTTADMYSGAVCQRLFFTNSSSSIEIRFAGNVSGGWTSCKLGVLYFQYSEFTRTYNGTYTSFVKTVESSPFRYITPAPTTPMTITFYNTAEKEYGINIYGNGASKGVTWSSQSRYTNVLASGSVSVSANSSSSPISATGVGNSGAFVLLVSPGLSAYSVSYTTTTNTFTIVNGNSSAVTVDYLAVRT